MQRPWRGTAYLIAFCGLLSLSYGTQDHQLRGSPAHNGLGPPTMGWALPHQSLIKKVPYRLVYIFLIESPSSQMTLEFIKFT